MREFFLFILSLFMMLTITAQTNKIDSLDRLIGKAVSDTERINQIHKKVELLRAINLDSSINLGVRTLGLAQEINYYKGELYLRQTLVSSYCYKGEYKLAEENLNFLEKFIKPTADSSDFANLYSNKGMMYGMQSKYDTSILFYEKSIHIQERINDKRGLKNSYANIAIGYQQQSNFAMALHYQQKSLKISDETKDEVNMAYTTMNIGNTYSEMSDTARAEQSFRKAIEIAKKNSLINVELYGYTNLASLYVNQKKWPLAYEYSMKAAELGVKLGDQGIQAASLSKAANALAVIGKLSEAEALSKRAIAIADSSAQPFNIHQAYSAAGNILRIKGNYAQAIPFYEKAFLSIKESDMYAIGNGLVYEQLSDCYEHIGNHKKALENFKIAKQIGDSVTSKNNIQKATEVTMNYEFEKKQQLQQAEQKAKDEIAGARQLALIVGLILTLALALVAFIAFRNKQKANQLLESQKNKIEQTLTLLKATQSQLIQSEKMASLGQLTAGIAHEIENPLNFVNNFSDLNKELLTEMKDEIEKGNYSDVNSIIDDVIHNHEKISHHGKRADTIVKGMLQHSRISSGHKEETDINKLTEEYLHLAYLGLRDKDSSLNISIKTETDPSIGNIPVIPQDIGRVLLNVYNNAFYSVSEKKKNHPDFSPEVFVSTSRKNGSVEIRIKDNGGGIPETIIDKVFQPFFTTKPAGQGTGLGLSLSYDIVKAHGGELLVKSAEGEGSEFIIKLNAGS